MIPASLKITIISHGLKTKKLAGEYVLPLADLYLDCRGVADGSGIKGVGKTGDDLRMQAEVKKLSSSTFGSYLTAIWDSLDKIPSRRSGVQDPYEKPYVICTLCAHGIHRSRSMKHLLAKALIAGGLNVEVK